MAYSACFICLRSQGLMTSFNAQSPEWATIQAASESVSHDFARTYCLGCANAIKTFHPGVRRFCQRMMDNTRTTVENNLRATGEWENRYEVSSGDEEGAESDTSEDGGVVTEEEKERARAVLASFGGRQKLPSFFSPFLGTPTDDINHEEGQYERTMMKTMVEMTTETVLEMEVVATQVILLRPDCTASSTVTMSTTVRITDLPTSSPSSHSIAVDGRRYQSPCCMLSRVADGDRVPRHRTPVSSPWDQARSWKLCEICSSIFSKDQHEDIEDFRDWAGWIGYGTALKNSKDKKCSFCNLLQQVHEHPRLLGNAMALKQPEQLDPIRIIWRKQATVVFQSFSWNRLIIRPAHCHCHEGPWPLPRRMPGPWDQPDFPSRVVKLLGNDDIKVVKFDAKSMAGLFVALSHCWGSKSELVRRPPYRLTRSTKHHLRSDGVSAGKLPLTLQHAVMLCRLLGLEYIWTDSLCILQSEGMNDMEALRDWETESTKMKTIYSKALLTIIAASPLSCHQGFFPAKLTRLEIRKTLPSGMGIYAALGNDEGDFWGSLEQEPLEKRGWTYQEELLSTRCVRFATNDIQWKCNAETAAMLGQSASPDYLSKWSVRSPMVMWERMRDTFMDPYGRVSDGSITIRAPIFSCHVHATTDRAFLDPDGLLSLTSDQDFLGRPRWGVVWDCPTERFLLPNGKASLRRSRAISQVRFENTDALVLAEHENDETEWEECESELEGYKSEWEDSELKSDGDTMLERRARATSKQRSEPHALQEPEWRTQGHTYNSGDSQREYNNPRNPSREVRNEYSVPAAAVALGVDVQTESLVTAEPQALYEDKWEDPESEWETEEESEWEPEEESAAPPELELEQEADRQASVTVAEENSDRGLKGKGEARKEKQATIPGIWVREDLVRIVIPLG
ncbi:heterokaryon incompatibility protein-domain-containing protein [Podospora australis]|uniref:Heterokaryon incompatibility protein-domain-containing protein n=1 Tax=Podospora australis TaxID=1536484 RepID=A0AAN6X088_9PEZI|nr:heterokaryon incompatibility protein-domain-containing protein [Podospora australis]